MDVRTAVQQGEPAPVLHVQDDTDLQGGVGDEEEGEEEEEEDAGDDDEQEGDQAPVLDI